MKKTRILISVISAILVLCMSITVFAEGKIFVDLVEVETDTPAQIVNDRTMVPVRAITEMLGYDVYWIAEKQQVEVCPPGSTVPVIIMNIGSTRAYRTYYEEALGEDMGAEVELDSPAIIINDRTFVPLRFISEAVGYTVDYNVDTKDVYLFSPEYMAAQEGEGKGEDQTTATPSEGEDSEAAEGEGVGEVVPLTYEEKVYVLEQTTETWLAMTAEEKADFVVLIGRWWEDYENIIVEDYDEMVEVLDHQMEQYSKNGVMDASVFETACEIYEVDKTVYIQE